MHIFNWLMVIGFMLILIYVANHSKRWVKNTADWLVAGRGVGKYLGATAGEAAATGDISIIAFLQAVFIGGPVAWWMITVIVVVNLSIAVSGWGIYRLRQTRVMTINELLEIRYSTNLRRFCGILCFISGVLNMGIFPIVSGRFIMYYTQLPVSFDVVGLSIPTIPLIAAIMVSIALLLVFSGGQISLLLTDFLQWTIIMFMFLAVGFVVYRIINWETIEKGLLAAENPRAMVDPFLPEAANQFGLWYAIMLTSRTFYSVISWAPNTSRSQSAKGANEAKLMWMLSYIRYGSIIGLLFSAVACSVFMTLPEFADKAALITERVNSISSKVIRSEMMVPTFLSHILPPAIQGIFLIGMICASISTLNAYFLSWGSVFIQDVVSPSLKRPLTQQQRLSFLKWSTIGVAIFVYIFSLLWRPTEYIWMYLAITATIYTGGAGVILLGALYWRRGTVQGAWAAMITGSTLPISGMILQQLYSQSPWWPRWLNGMFISFFACIAAILVYIAVSLLTVREKFDLDKLLNREPAKLAKSGWNIRTILSGFKERSAFEIAIAIITIVSIILILGGMLCSRIFEIPIKFWLGFWKWYFFLCFGLGIPVTIWFFIGSVIDIKNLIKWLRTETGDVKDDGQHSK
jgi:SSS family solute:Na+ symporter